MIFAMKRLIFTFLLFFRYDANKKKKIEEKVTKTSKVKLQNKAGLNKKNKGKLFGAPKQKKDKFKKGKQ